MKWKRGRKQQAGCNNLAVSGFRSTSPCLEVSLASIIYISPRISTNNALASLSTRSVRLWVSTFHCLGKCGVKKSFENFSSDFRRMIGKPSLTTMIHRQAHQHPKHVRHRARRPRKVHSYRLPCLQGRYYCFRQGW